MHTREPAGADNAPRLVGVGVGPGDPELLTLAAERIVRSAAIVFAPTTGSDPGRAEMVVRTAVPDVVVTRLPFAVAGTDAEQRAAHAAAASVVARALQPARTVAFVTLGDPNMYSTFWHLADAVRARHPEVVVDTVPGIMAFQAVAARGGGPLLDGAEHLVLVGAASGVDVEALDAALGDPLAAVVVYKGGRHLPALAAKLERARRVDGAVVGELLGLDGERVSTVRDAGERPANYLATAVVPPVRDRSERTR